MGGKEMKIKTLLKVCVFIVLILTSTEGFAKIIWFTFPELVKNSSIIAKGTISIRNAKPVLLVEQTLKGEAHRELIIQPRSWLDIPTPTFRDGEVVLLFLESPDATGTARLVGYGDQAKWPGARSRGAGGYPGYPKVLTEASLKDIQEVVEKLLQIEEASGLEKKTELCADYIRSSNPLLQLTGLQYVLQDLLWPPPPDNPFPRVPHEIAKKRFDILRSLSSGAVPLLESDKPSIRAAAIRLLRYAPSEVAMPNLIRKISDADLGVRTATRTVLNTLSIELKVGGKFEYSPGDSMDRLISVQDKWNNWWRENKDRLENMERLK